MSIPARIGIVTLGVSDLTRSIAFYRALGWELTTSSNADIAWFRTSGSALGLFPFDHLAADANLAAEPRGRFDGITLAINLERAEDVQPALDAAVAAGGTLLKPATAADWGGVSGYFADPDGHAWEIAWNPFFPLGPDGRLDIP